MTNYETHLENKRTQSLACKSFVTSLKFSGKPVTNSAQLSCLSATFLLLSQLSSFLRNHASIGCNPISNPTQVTTMPNKDYNLKTCLFSLESFLV